MSAPNTKARVSLYLDHNHLFIKELTGKHLLINHLLTLAFGNNNPKDREERDALIIKRIIKAMKMIKTEEYEKENNIIRPWKED